MKVNQSVAAETAVTQNGAFATTFTLFPISANGCLAIFFFTLSLVVLFVIRIGAPEKSSRRLWRYNRARPYF
jgi:hypothetical protein